MCAHLSAVARTDESSDDDRADQVVERGRNACQSVNAFRVVAHDHEIALLRDSAIGLRLQGEAIATADGLDGIVLA